MAKLNKDDLIASLKEMTILELNELIEAIEEEFGVTAAAPAAAAAVAADTASDEPTEVSVILSEVGASKVNVIKAVREITGLGLLEAKKLVDGAPAAIKEGISPAEAEDIKAKLVAAGASVDVK